MLLVLFRQHVMIYLENYFELCMKVQTTVFCSIPSLQSTVRLSGFVTKQVTGIHHKRTMNVNVFPNFQNSPTFKTSARIFAKSTTNSERPVRMHRIRTWTSRSSASLAVDVRNRRREQVCGKQGCETSTDQACILA